MIIILVIALRVIASFLILRYPLAGGFFALFLDAIDRTAIRLIVGPADYEFQTFFFNHYNSFDKLLDLLYLSTEFSVVLRWKETLARNAATALFVLRLFGVLLFEITGLRFLLFFMPNIFEFFYLAYLSIRKRIPDWEIKTGKRLVIFIALLSAPKLFQEYIIHIQDAAPWHTFKHQYLPWLP